MDVSAIEITPIKIKKQKPIDNIEENNFECDRCGRRYKRKVTLTRHLKFECGITPKFACSYCMHRFKRKEYLVAHLKIRHNHID